MDNLVATCGALWSLCSPAWRVQEMKVVAVMMMIVDTQCQDDGLMMVFKMRIIFRIITWRCYWARTKQRWTLSSALWWEILTFLILILIRGNIGVGNCSLDIDDDLQKSFCPRKKFLIWICFVQKLTPYLFFSSSLILKIDDNAIKSFAPESIF